jgi:hypothetical protein
VSDLALALLVGIVAFLAIASGVLVWDGLAAASAGRVAAPSERRLARLRLAVGVAGFGVALWLALGLLTHAH